MRHKNYFNQSLQNYVTLYVVSERLIRARTHIHPQIRSTYRLRAHTYNIQCSSIQRIGELRGKVRGSIF